MLFRTSPPYPRSDHYDGSRFFNPGIDTDKNLADLIRWRRQNQRARWPERRTNQPYPKPPLNLSPGEIAVTFIGHASFLIRTPEATMLTDPVFSERVSPIGFLGPKRVRPPGLTLDALPPLDVILLSHNHYDHMDLPSLRRLQARRGGRRLPIVTGLGNAPLLARLGMTDVSELDWWDGVWLSSDVRITFVPAQHWSSRTLHDRRRTLWGGFFIESGPATKLYFAGDSGYCPWFEAIRIQLGAPDLALLPIGAYEPRWFMRGQHMNPAEAVEAHIELQAKRSIGMHFGTFQLTDEPIDEPLYALERAKRAAGIAEEAFVALDVGETRVIQFDWAEGNLL
jgi:L-ascorbate metabolism protein UlaG (beta-lactamase superfamily)